jgi:hypothetical protein
MKITELESFFLVDGTCLALRYGHRKSVDLDLFSVTEFNNEKIIRALSKVFKEFTFSTSNNVGIFGYINNLKADFVKHHHFQQIDEPLVEGGIRMFSDRDIIAMKIFAVLKRAEKKDFWDIAELLQQNPVKDFISAYTEKYPSQQLLIAIPQALIYFDDAEQSEDPISLKNQTWENVKKIIRQKVSEFLK